MKTLATASLLAGLAAVVLAAASFGVLGRFTDTASAGANAFTTDTLAPPTAAKGNGGASVTLNWTATTDTYASGHRIFRGTVSGGPYTQIAQVTPRTTTTYVDTPGNGVFYYVVRAYYQNWESVNSGQVVATAGLLSCAANVAVTVSSGDNNGFQNNPVRACADDALFGQDTNSGNTTNTSCANTGKDRHLFYNYNASIPTGSTINGIELRLDAWADAIAGAPFICAELSWDGGATWTAVKATAALTAAQATYTLGGAADNWGHTWSATELTNGNFRVRITDVASNNSRDFRLDWAAVRFTYTAP